MVLWGWGSYHVILIPGLMIRYWNVSSAGGRGQKVSYVKILSDEDLVEFEAYSNHCPYTVCRNLYHITYSYKQLRDEYNRVIEILNKKESTDE